MKDDIRHIKTSLLYMQETKTKQNKSHDSNKKTHQRTNKKAFPSQLLMGL